MKTKRASRRVWRLYATWFVLGNLTGNAQQVADPDFKPSVSPPAFPAESGPVVAIDEAHNNYHTATGRYLPFAKLLRRDGYRVIASDKPFTRASLDRFSVLVIANALHDRNTPGKEKPPIWSLPTPSAFTDEEITVVRNWVHSGGALLLIADHMPMGGAAEKLAAAFGVRWNNGFVIETAAKDPRESADVLAGATWALTFERGDNSLADHAITRGRATAEKIGRVMTFTGSAFQAEGDIEPLLVLRAHSVSLMPAIAWQFKPDTPQAPMDGWHQGAVMKHGRGRVALFAEAAMFTAQLAGPNRTPVGMNSPDAPENAQFALNVLHWLSEHLARAAQPSSHR